MCSVHELLFTDEARMVQDLHRNGCRSHTHSVQLQADWERIDRDDVEEESLEG
jgi:hypothetical protein